MKIISVNISEKKGTVKIPVDHIELNLNGVKNDAHSGLWHRQVSLLGAESFTKFEQLAGRKVHWGEFAENITTEGIELYHCHPLDKFIIGDAVLEVTQIGKKCHGDSCAIYREVGSCVMPKEGIFCRVLHEGMIKGGDQLAYLPKTMRVLVITLSDRAYMGEYPDRSGPILASMLPEMIKPEDWPMEIENMILPDDAAMLKELIESRAEDFDFIFTTGGTGIGPRDITADTLELLIDREIPGIMDLIRYKYGSNNPNALISRSIAGLRGNTLIFALPGSTTAVKEYMEEIGRVIKHLVYMVHGIDNH